MMLWPALVHPKVYTVIKAATMSPNYLWNYGVCWKSGRLARLQETLAGLTERFNKTLVRMIKAYLKGEQTNWDRYLGCLAGAYRATIQESTGLTPNLLMLGREVRLPAEVMFGCEFELNSYGEYVDGLRKRMQQAHDVARKHLEAAAQRQKECYDANVRLECYQPGDLVWYQTEINQLKMNKKSTRKVVHHNCFRPY